MDITELGKLVPVGQVNIHRGGRVQGPRSGGMNLSYVIRMGNWFEPSRSSRVDQARNGSRDGEAAEMSIQEEVACRTSKCVGAPIFMIDRSFCRNRDPMREPLRSRISVPQAGLRALAD